MAKTQIISTMVMVTFLCAYSSTVRAQQDEDQSPALEEIIVTGSYIKRSSFSDVGSPIDVIDRNELFQDAATSKASDFLRYLPQSVAGVPAQEAGPGAHNNATTYGGATIDLRGLGAASTLVLLDGQRQARFPLSEDGAVDINSLIPNIAIKRVEVLKDGASGVYGTDAIAGVLNLIPYDDYDGFEVRVDYRTETESFTNEGITVSGIAGSPVGENFHVVGAVEYYQNSGFLKAELDDEVFTADTANFLTSSFGQPGSYGVPQRDALGNLTGDLVRVPDPECGRFQDEGISSFSATLPSAFGSESILDEANGLCRLLFSQQYFVPPEERWNGRVAVTGKLTETVTFRSSFGATFGQTEFGGVQTTPVLAQPTVPGENPGNPFRAMDANGNPLFAQDADGDGLPDRDGAGIVILAANPIDPASGVAFNEDVQSRIRPYSSSTSGESLFVPEETMTIRFAAGLDGAINDSWDWSVDYGYSLQKLDRRLTDSIVANLVSGLNCQLGQNGDLCFNPFGNSVFANEGDAGFNSPEVYDLIQTNVHDSYQTTVWSIDGILSGEVDLGLPAGSLGLALGAQVRRETLEQDFDSALASGQIAFWGAFDKDFEAADRTTSVFVEALFPVFKSGSGQLDLSTVARHESQDDSGLSSTNPKVSLLYSSDHFDVRASFAQSFLVPSLFQRFGSRSGFAEFEDPLNPGFIGQFPTRVGGATNAQPQEADSYNFGVTIRPVENLTLSIDYWSFEYTDLLFVDSAQNIVEDNPVGPNVIRDPATNQILRVDQNFFNAGSLDADGLDFSGSYTFPASDLGQFVLTGGATVVSTYDFQRRAGEPVIDGVGSDNQNGNLTPIPEVRGNLRLNWLSPSESHEVNLVYRFQGEVDAAFTDQVAEAQTPVDLQYSYNNLFDGHMRFTVGAINLFDDRSNQVAETAFSVFIATQDPLPRQIYVNFGYEF